MRRKTFDGLLTVGGLAIAVVLLVAGGLLTWANTFVNHQVRTQLSQQQIYFPPKGNAALAPKEIGPYLNKYAGKQLLTGSEAAAYANHFIAVHLQEIGGGKTYSQLSTEAQANPNDAALQAKVATVFKGTTLRGLLLNAYAFATMGTIAGIAATVSFIGAGLLLVLAALGFWHLRRTPRDQELGRSSQPPFGADSPAPAEAI